MLAEAKFPNNSVFTGKWALQATNKGGIPICVMLDTLPSDNYAAVGGQQAQRKLIPWSRN
jgi:hypothetical protein